MMFPNLGAVLNFLVEPPPPPDMWIFHHGVEISCLSGPGMNTRVRLRILADAVEIFGFPARAPFKSGDPLLQGGEVGSWATPVLCLKTNVPAYVIFIMRPNWLERTTTVEDDHQRVILREGVSWARTAGRYTPLEEEEEAHCRRMIKCGAAAVYDLMDPSAQTPPPGLFAWPAKGGVCFLRKPAELCRSYDVKMAPLMEALPSTVVLSELERNWKRIERYLQDDETMEDVCDILLAAGGQYFDKMEDCPEAFALCFGKR